MIGFFHLVTNNLHAPLANKLRALRISQGYEISEVAQACKIYAADLLNYEQDRETPKIRHLKRLAKFYGVSLKEFFRYD